MVGITMPRSTNFRVQAMSGYAAVILLLAGGMVLAIRRFDSVATAQITHIRAEENKITLGERLRSKGELIVSAGRGYLISGDPALLAKLQVTEAEFDRALHALKSERRLGRRRAHCRGRARRRGFSPRSGRAFRCRAAPGRRQGDRSSIRDRSFASPPRVERCARPAGRFQERADRRSVPAGGE